MQGNVLGSLILKMNQTQVLPFERLWSKREDTHPI